VNIYMYCVASVVLNLSVYVFPKPPKVTYRNYELFEFDRIRCNICVVHDVR